MRLLLRAPFHGSEARMLYTLQAAGLRSGSKLPNRDAQQLYFHPEN
jgi:hypothetical protein